jgi:hypothetical protein
MDDVEFEAASMCHLPNAEILNTLHEGVYLVDLDCGQAVYRDNSARIAALCLTGNSLTAILASAR